MKKVVVVLSLFYTKGALGVIACIHSGFFVSGAGNDAALGEQSAIPSLKKVRSGQARYR